MRESSGTETGSQTRGEPEAVLRAKYHDYCSAQVADTFLWLSPEEIYVLAEDAARQSGVLGDLSYETAVKLATERISAHLALPPFETWVQDYLSHPDRYDRYLMGLWESEMEAPRDA